ncbi:hypothetical protein RKD30_005553 [Streptomyces pristinaespiralis]
MSGAGSVVRWVTFVLRNVTVCCLASRGARRSRAWPGARPRRRAGRPISGATAGPGGAGPRLGVARSAGVGGPRWGWPGPRVRRSRGSRRARSVGVAVSGLASGRVRGCGGLGAGPAGAGGGAGGGASGGGCPEWLSSPRFARVATLYFRTPPPTTPPPSRLVRPLRPVVAALPRFPSGQAPGSSRARSRSRSRGQLLVGVLGRQPSTGPVGTLVTARSCRPRRPFGPGGGRLTVAAVGRAVLAGAAVLPRLRPGEDGLAVHPRPAVLVRRGAGDGRHVLDAAWTLFGSARPTMPPRSPLPSSAMSSTGSLPRASGSPASRTSSS